MYRPHKYFKRGSMAKHFTYGRSRYVCEVCKIMCTSYKQLEQHRTGIKHKMQKRTFFEEENTFSLEHMVVLDQTEEDLPNDNAASPASCDSSDSETAASSSDFHTIDSIPGSQMVILDETNDDNDHPASPASCDSSASEFAPSSPATVKTFDVIPKKKRRTEMPDDDQTAPASPLSNCSSFKSSTEPEAVHGMSEKSTGKEHHVKNRKTRHKESKKTFHITPVKSNKDVFQFLKTFAVANESDVAFAKKVKEIFSKALRKYEESELEKIFCTEAEHSSSEELAASTNCPSDHEQTDSPILQAINPSECRRINSAPGSPIISSPTQCISNSTSSANCQPDLRIINQSDYSDSSSVASRSPSNKCEDIETSSKPSADSTNDNPCSATETDLFMEGENCITAEAACSDDEDV